MIWIDSKKQNNLLKLIIFHVNTQSVFQPQEDVSIIMPHHIYLSNGHTFNSLKKKNNSRERILINILCTITYSLFSLYLFIILRIFE